jgi:hypothetical protein
MSGIISGSIVSSPQSSGMSAHVRHAAIDALLRADARGLRDVARPALHRVAPAEADIERTADVTLRALS